MGMPTSAFVTTTLNLRFSHSGRNLLTANAMITFQAQNPAPLNRVFLPGSTEYQFSFGKPYFLLSITSNLARYFKYSTFRDVKRSWTQWSFKTVPIGGPETSVTTNLRCVTFRKIDDLIYTTAEARTHAQLDTLIHKIYRPFWAQLHYRITAWKQRWLPKISSLSFSPCPFCKYLVHPSTHSLPSTSIIIPITRAAVYVLSLWAALPTSI